MREKLFIFRFNWGNDEFWALSVILLLGPVSSPTAIFPFGLHALKSQMAMTNCFRSLDTLLCLSLTSHQAALPLLSCSFRLSSKRGYFLLISYLVEWVKKKLCTFSRRARTVMNEAWVECETTSNEIWDRKKCSASERIIEEWDGIRKE